MKKRDLIALSVLAVAGGVLVSSPRPALAQSIYVQDTETGDELNQNLNEIQFYINGSSRQFPHMEEGLVKAGPTYNTNYLLSGETPGSKKYNNNNLLQEIMFEVGGPYPATATDNYSSSSSGPGAGTATSYFNTNILLRNAFLGPSGMDGNIALESKGAILGSLIKAPTLDGTTKLGSITADIIGNEELAQKSASAKFIDSPSNQVGVLFKIRCNGKFTPTKEDDAEGKFISKARTSDNLECSNQDDTYVRRDRSLESLLGPMQYVAPKDMDPPTSGAGETYDRFGSTTPTELTYPTFAAAGFCQNISAYYFADTPSKAGKNDAMDVSNKMAIQESIDSRIVANCWHFFEERVQYRHGDQLTKQAKRCTDDYEIRHIIDKKTSDDCQAGGRSSLRARYDMAYRMDSPEYITYLNTLGAAVRAQLVAQAYADAERFEQSLLLERQIMTQALTAVRREKIDHTKVQIPSSFSKSSGDGS